ncbi:MAG: glycosyltransferase family 2 protein [Phycisphaerae bacterium]
MDDLPNQTPPLSLADVGIIIPALNEEESLRILLPQLTAMQVGQIVVADNGSTDRTAEVARSSGVTCVHEPKRGYGAACWAGMKALAPSIRAVAFLDADLSDDANYLHNLLARLNEGYDLVVSTRIAAMQESGSMTLPQRIGNVLMPTLIRLGWGFRYTDLGPFRIIRREPLDSMQMQDRDFGWTIEMQIRAVEMGIRIVELPVPYRKRKGTSKISGTIRGVYLATYWILRTCTGMWLTKSRRRDSRMLER